MFRQIFNIDRLCIGSIVRTYYKKSRARPVEWRIEYSFLGYDEKRVFVGVIIDKKRQRYWGKRFPFRNSSMEAYVQYPNPFIVEADISIDSIGKLCSFLRGIK